MDEDASFIPEVPGDHEVPVIGAIDEVNTQKTPKYDTIIDLDVAIINKNDKNKWRTIYKAIDEPYFGEFKLFPREFINICKKYPNDPQKHSSGINKNLKIALDGSLYAHVVRICCTIMVQKKIPVKNLEKYLFQGQSAR